MMSGEWFQRARGRFAALDVLVNSARLYGWLNKKAVGDPPEETWERTMSVNLRSVSCSVRTPSHT